MVNCVSTSDTTPLELLGMGPSVPNKTLAIRAVSFVALFQSNQECTWDDDHPTEDALPNTEDDQRHYSQAEVDELLRRQKRDIEEAQTATITALQSTAAAATESAEHPRPPAVPPAATRRRTNEGRAPTIDLEAGTCPVHPLDSLTSPLLPSQVRDHTSNPVIAKKLKIMETCSLHWACNVIVSGTLFQPTNTRTLPLYNTDA